MNRQPRRPIAVLIAIVAALAAVAPAAAWSNGPYKDGIEGNGYGTHSYLKRSRHHNTEGVVLMGTDPEDPEVRRLVRSEMPTVGVDVALEGPSTTYVISDNVDGASRAVRHFHSIGHRRIATITGMLETRTGGDRLRINNWIDAPLAALREKWQHGLEELLHVR